jgi:hypothetical protein
VIITPTKQYFSEFRCLQRILLVAAASPSPLYCGWEWSAAQKFAVHTRI